MTLLILLKKFRFSTVMIFHRATIAVGRYGRRVIRSLPTRTAASLSTLNVAEGENSKDSYANALLAAAVTMCGLTASVAVTACDSSGGHPHFTPSQVAKEAYPSGDENEDEMDKDPVYTSDQVAENDGTDGKPVWMSYGGVVYDVTDFIPNHPGGSEKVSVELPFC